MAFRVASYDEDLINPSEKQSRAVRDSRTALSFVQDNDERERISPVLPHTVHLHAFQAFSCTSCGRCCRPWEVALEGVQRRAIEQSVSYQQKLQAGYLPLKVQTAGVGELQDRGDGHCAFLSADDLCQLHAELGGRLKPLGCQLFPYQTVRTPDGMFVYLSFGCPPVVAGQDRDLASNQDELDVALADYSTPLANTASQPYRVDLSQTEATSWEGYLRLETEMVSAYRPARPIRSCLGLAMAILAAPTPEEIDLQTAFSSEDVDFALEILRKYASSMVSVVENLDEDAARLALAAAIEAGETTVSPRFELSLPPMTLAEPEQPLILNAYQRYFHNAILGKAALRTTVVAKLLSMACGFVLTRFYAEAFRATRHQDLVDLDCLTDAFAITEFHQGIHSPAMGGYSQAMEESYAYIVGAATDRSTPLDAAPRQT